MAEFTESAPVAVTPRLNWKVYLGAALLAVLFFRALVVPLFIYDMLRYPLDYFIGEGDQLFYIHRLLRGQTIYSNSTALPFMGNVYPPIYPWLGLLCAKFVKPSLAMGRVLGAIPLAGTMAVVGVYLRRAKVNWPIVVGAALLIPCCYSLSQFLIMPRSDGWMTFFCLGSLYWLSAENAAPHELILGGLASALALFTKQTAMFALFPLHAHLLLKAPRKGLLAGAAAAVFCTILLAISYWEFGSTLLEAMTSLTARRQFDAHRLIGFWFPVVVSIAPVALLSCFRSVRNLYKRQWELLDTCIVGGLGLTLLMSFDASGSNYFLPLFPMLVVAAALLTQECVNAPRLATGVPLAALVAIAAAVWFQLPFEKSVVPPAKDELAEAEFAAAFLTSTDEPVYTERFWGPVADRPYLDQYFVEPTHIRALPVGRFDANVLESTFHQRKYARVLLYARGFSYPKFAEHIQEDYKIVRVSAVKVCFGDAGLAVIHYLERK